MSIDEYDIMIEVKCIAHIISLWAPVRFLIPFERQDFVEISIMLISNVSWNMKKVSKEPFKDPLHIKH